MLALFLIETKDKKHDSDYMYIKAFLEQFYVIGNNIKLQPIYLNGKSNYCKKETTIKNAVKAYCSAPQSDKKVNIFLCVDTDDISGGQAAENAILNEAISKYCKQKSWELIWFCENVEEAFLGRKVHSSEKVKMAGQFYTNGGIKDVNPDKLSIKKYEQLRRGTSTIATALDRVFKREIIMS